MSDSRADALEEEDCLEYRLAVAYQVVGCLLDHLGVHDTTGAQKLLDYFANYKDAPDPLPFFVTDLLSQTNKGGE